MVAPSIPDSVVIEIRRKAEVERLPVAKIAEQYPQHSLRWIRQIIGYELRAKVALPKEKP